MLKSQKKVSVFGVGYNFTIIEYAPKNLMTRIPPRSSWMSLARLSVQTMACVRRANIFFIAAAWKGLPVFRTCQYVAGGGWTRRLERTA